MVTAGLKLAFGEARLARLARLASKGELASGEPVLAQTFAI